METSRMHREITINRMAATMAHLSAHDLAVRVVELLINDQGNINRYQETIELVLEAHRQCVLIHRIGKDRIKHRKGGTYELAITIGRVQTDRPLKDYDEVSVYLAESDGSWWIRPLDEMGDGRFEIVESIPKHELPADGKLRSSSGFTFDGIVLAPGSALRRIIDLETIIERFDRGETQPDATWKKGFEDAIAECRLMAADPHAKPEDKKFYQGVLATVDTLEIHMRRLEDKIKATVEPSAPAMPQLEWGKYKGLIGYKLCADDLFGNEFARIDLKNGLDENSPEVLAYKAESQARYEEILKPLFQTPGEKP